jgi:phosphate-selective porin OprO/OprP
MSSRVLAAFIVTAIAVGGMSTLSSRAWGDEKPPAPEQSGKPGAGPMMAAGKEGFVFTSGDGAFQLRIRGLLQTDGRFYLGDDTIPLNDTFLVRRARPIFEATLYRYFDIRLVPDFGSGATSLEDAYMEARFSPAVKLRAGKFKAPVGLERLQTDNDLLFTERSLPTNLVPNRDVGVQLHGDVCNGCRGAVSYAVGLFNGVSDGASADGDVNDSKEAAARVFYLPFRNGRAGLRGLGFGLAGTRGVNHGTVTSTSLSGFKTAGQQTFFDYLSDGTPAGTTIADGHRARLSPQLYYYLGRFGLQAEQVSSSQTVSTGAATRKLTHSAWQVSTSFMLTADKARWNGVDPAKPFDPATHSYGAFELTARVGRLSIDRGAFPVFADPAKFAREAFERSVGFNWYLSKGVRLMIDEAWTTFDGGGGAAGPDREDEKALLGRFQIAF